MPKAAVLPPGQSGHRGGNRSGSHQKYRFPTGIFEEPLKTPVFNSSFFAADRLSGADMVSGKTALVIFSTFPNIIRQQFC